MSGTMRRENRARYLPVLLVGLAGLFLLAACTIEVMPAPEDTPIPTPVGPSPTSTSDLISGVPTDVTPAALLTAQAVRAGNPDLNGVWMVNATDGWAVGRLRSGGVIQHYDGHLWALATTVPGAVLYGVEMVSATEGWTVGESTDDQGATTGLILHYHDGVWTPQASPPEVLLHGLDMVSATEGWAVGFYGILHYSGGVWTEVPNPAGVPLQTMSIAMLSATEGWTLGRANDDKTDVALHYLDGQWTATRLGTRVRPTSVQMLSPTNGWAVGQYGLLHYRDGKWSKINPPVSKPLRQIFLVSPTAGWAIGSDPAFGSNDPVFMYYTASGWANQPATINPWLLADGNHGLNSLYMLSATDGWVVGDDGTILHYQDKEWQPYNPFYLLTPQPWPQFPTQ